MIGYRERLGIVLRELWQRVHRRTYRTAHNGRVYDVYIYSPSLLRRDGSSVGRSYRVAVASQESEKAGTGYSTSGYVANVGSYRTMREARQAAREYIERR